MRPPSSTLNPHIVMATLIYLHYSFNKRRGVISICKEKRGSRLSSTKSREDVVSTLILFQKDKRESHLYVKSVEEVVSFWNAKGGVVSLIVWNRNGISDLYTESPHSRGNSDLCPLLSQQEERGSSLSVKKKRGSRLSSKKSREDVVSTLILFQKEKRESHLYVKRAEEVVSPRNAKGRGRPSHRVKSEWHLRSLHWIPT